MGFGCLRTWPPAGLTAKCIKAPLSLFDFPRREVHTLDILYLHIDIIVEHESYSCIAKVPHILCMSMQ